MKHYFFRTVKEGSSIRVVPVSGQVMVASGKPVNDKMKVSCPRDVRTKVPVGSIFVGDCLRVSSRGYYTTSNFRVLVSGSAEDVEYKSLGSGSSSSDSSTKKKEPDTLLSKILSDTSLVLPTSKVDGYYMSKDSWSLLVRNIKRHVNTMIIGPTGCGKTSCVKEVCSRMGIKLHIFDMGSMVDPISSLLGVHRLEGGKSIFDYAQFTQAIQEPCVILLDELNRAALSCNNVLFPCLDDRRTLSIEVAGGKDVRSIKVHPEVTFIATANIGAEYSGTNTMDRALVNRFFPLELGNIPANEECTVLETRCKVDHTTSALIVKIANNIRSLSQKQEISATLSIRETIMVANLVSDGWTLGSAMEMVYLPLYEGSKSEGERGTVYKTIGTY